MMEKFRAWDKGTDLMNEVTVIDFESEEVYYHHWRYGHSKAINLKNIELMQSTGLKDKNGVEIFEGDIVEAVRKHSEPKLIEDRYCKGIITYSHGCYDIEVEPNVFSGLIPENLLTDIDLTIEVIGNIYENEDLLK